ncbi:MAG: ankyrin repeat domain-containing protein [Verrucomicrobiota bacterium]|nr:ankyrin repeat domain-containing protein [Verrucomicrobiota bacterium]
MSPARARLIGIVFIGALACAAAVMLVPKLHRPAKLPADSIARAVETRDRALLERSASAKVDPNVPNSEGVTPLVLAMQQNDAGLIARLLDLGADVDAADRDGVTPIMRAAEQGNMELLRNFAERSHKLDAADSAGRTAAHYALLAEQREAFELLLPRLERVDVPMADGRELLAIASESGKTEFIRPVLERLPSGLAWAPPTRAALKLAIDSKDPELLRLVVSKHAMPPMIEGGTTPLLAHAIADDNSELFNALLAAGADPNTTIATPAEKPFVSMIKSEDLRGYVRSDEAVTVLMIAAGLGKTEYVRALLDAGADRNRDTKKFKMLALYFAAHAGKAKCIQTLLGRGPTPEELRIEVSLATQRASVFKHGVAILQTTVSTGRDGFSTPTGEYVITDKNRDHRSSIYKVEMPFFMRLNCRDFGMHAGNVAHNRASHGCIRLPPEIAQKLFAEIPVGTVVTIN